jgi:hypothetical protein
MAPEATEIKVQPEAPVVDTCQQEQPCQQKEETVVCTESVATTVETPCEKQEEVVVATESTVEAPLEQSQQQCCSDFCATQAMAMQANTTAIEVKKSWWRRMVGI